MAVYGIIMIVISSLIGLNGLILVMGMDGKRETTRQVMSKDECSLMYTCSSELYDTQKGCACDDMCHVYGDCCEDKARKPNIIDQDIRQLNLKTYGDCTSIYDYEETVFLVNKCPVGYDNNYIKLACENIDEVNSGDLYYRLPVSHIKLGIVYNNLYCALCHSWTKDQVSFWDGEMQCGMSPDLNIGSDLNCAAIDPNDIWCLQYVAQNENGNRIIGKPHGMTYMEYLKTLTPDKKMELGLCTFKFRPNFLMEKPRICLKVFDNCPPTWTDEHIRYQCEKGINAYVWSNKFDLSFKNEQCAICNSVVYYDCKQPVYLTNYTQRPSSISIHLDFNNGHISSQTHSGSCDYGFVFDVIMARCRPLLCSLGFFLKGDRCVRMSSGDKVENGTDYEGITSCAKVQVDEGGYIFLSDGSVYINASDIIFPFGEYIFENTSVLVCADNFAQNYTYIESVFNYSIVQGLISMTGQVISIVALCLLLFVYCTNKPLQTVPGKCLICLSAFLALAQFFFIIGGFSRDATGFCHFLAIVTHFCFLASFFWMNVMGFDVWKTFHDQFSFSSGHKRMKKFTGYCIYAVSVPMIIVALGIILDSLGDIKVKPHYGDGFCWINDTYAFLYLFSLPLFIILCVNIVFFSLAVYNIYKVSVGTKVLRKKKPGAKKKRIVLYVKLSSVMGLTWVFGFLAAFTKSVVLWYFFIIFNPLQGLFICIAFLCNRKVFHIITRYRERVSTAFNSLTISSRLSSRRSSSQDASRKYIKTRSLRVEVSDPDKGSAEPGPISNPEHD